MSDVNDNRRTPATIAGWFGAVFGFNREMTGWHVLAWMAAFFGLMFAVNGVFLYNAITSFPGEDTPKSYVQGLDYNSVLADRASQTARGWEVEIGVQADALIVRVFDEDGSPVGGKTVSATLQRPATTKDDRALDLQSWGGGEYRAPIDPLSKGRWNATVMIVDPISEDILFEARKTLYLP